MEYGFISCIPLIVLIVGALITKRVAEMMILSSLLGAILVYKGNFFTGYIETIYKVLSNSSYQFVLIILIGFGGMIKLFQNSGALLGFGSIMSKYAKGPKKPLIAAWIMAFFVFVDDYINTLAVSFSMREITDKNDIPREHLAYQASSMAASLCVLIPFTSWTAFTTGLISEQGLGFSDYIKAIPFMFFPLLSIVVCLCVAAGILPKVGLLKKSYARIAEGGPILEEEKTGVSIVDLEMPDHGKASSALNFIIPIITMVVVVLLFDNELIHGLLAAIFVQGILYVGQRIMTLTQFMNHFFDGAKSMVTLAIIIGFAFMLNSANQAMGFSEYLIGGIGQAVPSSLLPALVFIVIGLATFATSGYWVMQVITIPIFIPLAISMGVNPSFVIAAIMSGVVFGSIFCFYSDVVFMTSAGTGVSNIRQIKVSAPYIIGAAVLTIIGYIIIGVV